MKLNIFSSTLFTLIVIALVIFAVFVTLIIKNQFELQKSNEILQKSYVFAEELRKTSDDLTRYCRSYIITSDTIWENKYKELIDVCNGKKPRANGQTIALLDTMKNIGFTKAEFDKLKKTIDNSISLLWKEKNAFNAMKGKFADSLKQFTISRMPDTAMARRIMFDKKYHYDKLIIMKSIDDFIIMLNKRTQETADKFKTKSYNLIFFTLIINIITLFFSIFLFSKINKKILKQMKELQEKTKAQNSLNQQLYVSSLEIDQQNIEIKEHEFIIIQQNEELKTSQENLKQSNEELITLNENIENQKSIITHKNKQLEILLNNLPAHIYFKNNKLEYVLANKSYSNLFADKEKTIIGKRDSDFLNSKIAKIYEEVDKEIISSKKSKLNIIQKHTKPDNNEYYTSTSKIIYNDDEGNTIGITGIVLDITERILREKKLKQNKETIESAHKDITDSINYAKRIQTAILPSLDLLPKKLSEHFILFKPRDVVSGDFYWWTNMNNKTIITVADCTGHGVPGAFMSMLGISMLRDIINKQNFTNTSVILQKLRKEIIKTLQSGTQDGMDMAIISIDQETKKLQFSGANNPLFLIRKEKFETKTFSNIRIFNNENKSNDLTLYEFKADKMPVATYAKMNRYKVTELKLQTGDCLYMFSDGYIDQFGGERNRKFMSKKFKNLLLNNAHKSMSEQKEILNKTHYDWKGKIEQVDDIIVFGMKFTD